MTYLHSDFLESSAAYDRARDFWRSLWQEAQAENNVEWQFPWLTEPTEALRDGNPIFTAWSRQLRRGVRVIQRAPVAEVPDLVYWLDVFGGGLQEPDAVEELVVSCSPGREVVSELRALIAGWISGAPLSVTVETPQLMTESRQLVVVAGSHNVGKAA